MKNNNREIISLLAKNMYRANVVRNRILITAIALVVIMLFGVVCLLEKSKQIIFYMSAIQEQQLIQL